MHEDIGELRKRDELAFLHYADRERRLRNMKSSLSVQFSSADIYSIYLQSALVDVAEAACREARGNYTRRLLSHHE